MRGVLKRFNKVAPSSRVLLPDSEQVEHSND